MSGLSSILYDPRLVGLAERGLVPDAIVRAVIRQGLRARLAGLPASEQEARRANARFVEAMRESPLALSPDLANEQHYEVPAAFFEGVLGPRLKYSCCLFRDGSTTLAEAEEAMLRATCERAGIEDGMRVLDLGCGWGSLSLWIAEHFPNARVTAVSNSKSQGEHIRRAADTRGFGGVEVVTADMNAFDPGARFDRVVSVEMFEHMRNWPMLLDRIAGWLLPGGRLFAHFFCHREHAYPYETASDADWMGRHFFTGGMMPSEGLILELDAALRVDTQWRVSGVHYQYTCEEWLANLDARREALLPVLADTYGDADARRWLGRWRLFFIACAELFGFAAGSDWFVTHALLSPRER